jgi:hypothetical protein
MVPVHEPCGGAREPIQDWGSLDRTPIEWDKTEQAQNYRKSVRRRLAGKQHDSDSFDDILRDMHIYVPAEIQEEFGLFMHHDRIAKVSVAQRVALRDLLWATFSEFSITSFVTVILREKLNAIIEKQRRHESIKQLLDCEVLKNTGMGREFSILMCEQQPNIRQSTMEFIDFICKS